jgi:hypothetical protein
VTETILSLSFERGLSPKCRIVFHGLVNLTQEILLVTVFGVLFYSHSFFTTQVVPTPGEFGCQLNNDYRELVAVITYIDTGITFVFPFVAIFVLNIVVIVTT